MTKFASRSAILKNFKINKNDKFESLSKNSKNIIFTFDKKYRILSANDKAAEFIGIPPEAAIGKTIFKLVPERFLRGKKKKLDKMFKSGGVLAIEYWLEINRMLKYYHAEFEPILDEKGAVESILTVAQDCTDVKKQEVLTKVVHTFSGSNSVDDIANETMIHLNEIIPFDKSSIAVVSEDKKSFNIYKYDANNPKKLEIFELNFDDTILSKVYSSGKSVLRNELETKKKMYKHDADLASDQAKSQLFAPIIHNGEVIGTLNFCSKETDKFSKEHEVLVNEVTYIIAQPLLRIQQYGKLNELKLDNEFYNDLMTHNLNNINQGLMGYYELLQLQPDLSDNQKNYLSESISLIQESTNLLTNVRTLSMIKTTDLKLTPTDIYPYVIESIDDLYKQFPDIGMKIKHNLEEGQLKVTGNEFLKDIFVNILNNCVKFDKNENYKINIHASRKKVEGRSYVHITISDHGPGIPDSQKEFVFERYTAPKLKKLHGAGLGLTLVREIVDKYNGFVWVEDRIAGDNSKGCKLVLQIPEA